MQFKEWLRRNEIRTYKVADAWGLSYPGLSRIVNGSRPPTFQILIRSWNLTRGEVTLLDWIETCRDRLVKDGIIEDGEQFYGAKTEGKRVRGRKPGTGKARKAKGQHERSAA